MRRVLLIGWFFLPLLPIGAQATGSVVAGLVSSNNAVTDGNITLTYQSRTGFAAGVELTAPMSRPGLEFNPSLLFVEKGSSYGSSSGTLHINLNYIEVPLLFRLSFSEAGARPFVVLGPHLAIKTSCTLKFDATSGASDSQKCADVDASSDVKGIDFGLTAGAGVKLRQLGLSARYDLGLSNIPRNTGSGSSVHNRAWLFLASFAVR